MTSPGASGSAVASKLLISTIISGVLDCTLRAYADDMTPVHRDIWKQRMRTVEELSLEVLEGMTMQVERESAMALRLDLGRSRREYTKWLADAVSTDPGRLHIITKPQNRYEQE